MIAHNVRIEALIVCASITTLGIYACTLWERSIREAKQQAYLDALVRVVESIARSPALRRVALREGRAPNGV
tara:strand:+ start:757 stop:972 length:216 start_codon:yes stop_codon:yes gene_type:complete